MPSLEILPPESRKDAASQTPPHCCGAAQGGAWSFDRITDRFKSISWDVAFLADPSLRLPQFGIPDEAKKTKHPIRLLRYWFMHHFIHNGFLLKRRTVNVCEIGVDSGQMLQFMQAAVRGRKTVPEWSNWVAVDVELKKQALTACGYKELIQGDLESPDFTLPQQYDVVILLHVLEHLREPEKVFEHLVEHLVEGGVLIGGFPCHPNFLVPYRERHLRKHARKGGHVSAFSPKRVKAMAQKSGLRVEFLSGAFLLRHKGLFLENFAWWARFNLLFGALFPAWPGEIYWMVRKEGASRNR